MQNTAFGQQPEVAAYAPPAERMAFLRKIYALLSVSIFVAAGAAAFVLSDHNLIQLTVTYRMPLFILELAILFLGFRSVKKPNQALFTLFVFTALTGVTTVPILLQYTGGTIVQAATLTGIIFVGLSLYTINSKKDFSFMGGMLVTVLIVAIVGSLLNVFFFHSSLMSFGISSLSVVLFSGFIIYDTSNILRHYSTDMYIPATLALYLDILLLFQHLLRILGGDD